MKILPPHLVPGDLILLLSPAKAIDQAFVDHAKSFFEKAGFRVEVAPNALNSWNYFAGTDEERSADFQWAIDHPEAKAIVCNRGGYGCIRIFDHIQWANQLRFPKWIVGFSDVTVFHQFLQKNDAQSIHASMPLNFKENTAESLTSLVHALKGETIHYKIPSEIENKVGEATGKLVGGNLSILYSLLGTDLMPDYSGSILFFEDLAEQIYHVDRMFYAFAKAGVFNKISGVIVGGMTDLKDTTVPFGKNYKELLVEHLQFRKIPVAFHFPAGHIDDNRALILGREVKLQVTEIETELRFLK